MTCIYAAGKILQIYCENFLIYDKTTVYPGEYLNLVLGPNGNGKSSIVSAIILGMGGDPKVLARATDIGSFIQNGKSKARIEIELSDGKGGSTKYQREFGHDNKSHYKINDKSVGKQEFLKSVSVHNIQVNNLCQFLPQERVHDFAAKSVNELFEDTLKSVCAPNVMDQFNILKELRLRQLNANKNEMKTKRDLAQLKSQEVELKRQFEELRNHQRLIVDRDIAKAKLKWQEALELAKALKSQQKDAAAQIKICEQYEEQLQKEQQNGKKLEQEVQQLQTECKANQDNQKRLRMHIQQSTTQMDDLKCKIHQQKCLYATEKRQRQVIDEEISNKEEMLEAFKVDLRNMQAELPSIDLQQVDDEIAAFTRKLDIKRTEHNRINVCLETTIQPEVNNLQRKIEREQNVQTRKMQLLKDKFENVYNAVIWLEENRHMFSGHVYKPLLMELNVLDARHAKYLENVISIRDLIAFTCESKSDLSLLVRELNTKRNLKINVCHSAAAVECNHRAELPIEQLRQYGFSKYLLELVEAPPAILNNLCSLYGIHRIPVGNESVCQHTDNIPAKINLYFGGDLRYTSTISKYSGEQSLMQQSIRGKNLLFTQNHVLLREYNAELAKWIAESDKQRNMRTRLEAELDELKAQRVELQKCKHKFNELIQLQAVIKQHEVFLQKLKERRISHEDMKAKFLEGNKNIIKSLKATHLQLLEHLQKHVDCQLSDAESELLLRLHSSELNGWSEKLANLRSQLHEANKLLETIRRKQQQTRDSNQKKIQEAKELIKSDVLPNDAKFAYRQQFQALPTDLAELAEVISDCQARLDCLEGVDENVIQQYDDVKAQIESMEATINQFDESQQQIQHEITTAYDDWMPQIANMVESINNNFHNFMESMGLVGEVLLQREHEHDFQTYGIRINVKYRKDEPLQALNKYHQSGGERSVAIAVYLLALQNLTQVPFRCIDEINQGMDPKNERKIFQMIMDTSSQLHQAQTFVVTPKLLENLPSNDYMHVIIVFNAKLNM